MILAKRTLHQSIVDLEKQYADKIILERRIKTKHATLLVQTMELESELSAKGLLSSEQVAKLE